MAKKSIEELNRDSQSPLAGKRISVAMSSDATPEMLAKLIFDKDFKVAVKASENPNIDDHVFKELSDNFNGLVNDKIYKNFYYNNSFKKEWIYDYVEFLAKFVGLYRIAISSLEDERFFSNDDEWLALFEVVKKHCEGAGLSWLSFWFNFFKYPKKNYSENIILSILDYYGEELSELKPIIFTFIVDTPMETPKIKLELFKLTNDDRYIPNDAKDIFLF